MATVTIRLNGLKIAEKEAITDYLRSQGVLYESWGVERLDRRLRSADSLSEEEQRTILDLYGREISDLRARQGYVTQDIVALSPTTPNLDTILEKFGKEHHHTDDEVRFVVSGSGIFSIRKGKTIFDILVEAGDLLVVPAYTRHWFDLTPKRSITCIRIFKDPAGWQAIYDESAVAQSGAR